MPYTRGLGSSSTCIVAGIVGAFAFKDKTDARQEILELATKIERTSRQRCTGYLLAD